MTVEPFDNVKSLIDDVEVTSPSQIIADNEIELMGPTDNGQNSWEKFVNQSTSFLAIGTIIGSSGDCVDAVLVVHELDIVLDELEHPVTCLWFANHFVSTHKIGLSAYIW